METWAKVALGVGAVLVVGAAVAKRREEKRSAENIGRMTDRLRTATHQQMIDFNDEMNRISSEFHANMARQSHLHHQTFNGQ